MGGQCEKFCKYNRILWNIPVRRPKLYRYGISFELARYPCIVDERNKIKTTEVVIHIGPYKSGLPSKLSNSGANVNGFS